MTSLAEAREKTRAKLLEGKNYTCPCCGQNVKLYARKITKVMAKQLIHLYRNGPTDRGALNVITDGAHEWMPHKLHLWGLINLAKENRDGKYSITAKGREFVEGKISVPKFLHTYNSEIVSQSYETVTLSDCLGEQWDFIEMVETKPPQAA